VALKSGRKRNGELGATERGIDSHYGRCEGRCGYRPSLELALSGGEKNWKEAHEKEKGKERRSEENDNIRPSTEGSNVRADLERKLYLVKGIGGNLMRRGESRRIRTKKTV